MMMFNASHSDSQEPLKVRDAPPLAPPLQPFYPHPFRNPRPLMLGNVPGLQPQSQPQNLQQQVQQQQQGAQNQVVPQPPPPPPLNGQDLNLSNILHFLQSEWRRYERDRNEWEIERAEMRARIALLEGERRSFENTRLDLLRRVKMLEYALRIERSKQLNQPSTQSSTKSSLQNQMHSSSHKEDAGSHKEGSNGSSSPRSEDVPLPSENRMSIASLSGLSNGVQTSGPAGRQQQWVGSNWGVPNAGAGGLGKPPPGRDPKSRARSRDYLKQCLQEITYLTSPQAMNPLPNRPILSNPTVPLALPNVPSFDQIAYNGRPRKLVPEVGKDFPVLNGMSIMGGPSSVSTSSGHQVSFADRDGRISTGVGVSQQQPHPQQPQQGSQVLPPQSAGFPLQAPQQQSLSQAQSLQLQTQQLNKDTKEADEIPEPQQLTAIFRPDAEWKERIERARSERYGQQPIGTGASAWDHPKDEEEDGKEEEPEIEDEETASVSDDDSKIWRPRRTLRNHLDAVRAIAFHPNEMCLATGSDDCTIKIWKMDAVGLASSGNRATTDVEPQMTLRGHTAAVTALVHSPSKHLLYSASLDSLIRVWSLPHATHTTYAPYDNSRVRGELVGHTDAVWGLALMREESILVSCASEGSVKVWDVSAASGIGSLKLSWGYSGLDSEDEETDVTDSVPIACTALEPIKSDLKRIAVAYANAVVKLFDVDTGKQLLRLHAEPSEDGLVPQRANAITSHPTLQILVTGHEDKHIRIWDIETGQLTYSMLAHVDAVTSLSIDSAGFCLVSGGHDCSIRFWDLLGTRSCLQELSSHREKAREGVLAVEFHPSLPFMASAGADGVIKLHASS